jgi:hypothetical protein
MMKLMERGGGVLEARDAAGIVRRMQDGSFTGRGQTTMVFMREVAERVQIMTGQTIRTGDEAQFVADLTAAGYLQPA